MTTDLIAVSTLHIPNESTSSPYDTERGNTYISERKLLKPNYKFKCIKHVIVGNDKRGNIFFPFTCHDTVSSEPWFRRSRLFHVAVRAFVLWDVHVWIIIFHCRKHVLWITSAIILAVEIMCFHGLCSTASHELLIRSRSSSFSLCCIIFSVFSASCSGQKKVNM